VVRPIVEISPGLRLDESNAGKLVEQDAGLSLEGMAGALHGQPIRLLVSHSAGCSQHFCRRGAGRGCPSLLSANLAADRVALSATAARALW